MGEGKFGPLKSRPKDQCSRITMAQARRWADGEALFSPRPRTRAHSRGLGPSRPFLTLNPSGFQCTILSPDLSLATLRPTSASVTGPRSRRPHAR